MKVADIIGSLIGVLIGVYAIWEGRNMPADRIMKIGPSFFPSILAGLLILFSLVLLVNALRGRSIGTVERARLSDKGVQRGLITLAATLVFCAVVTPLGFMLSSILFLLFMMLLLGNRKPLQLAVAPPLISVAIWVIFEKVLKLSMPAGVLAGIL